MGFRYKCQRCYNYHLCQDCFWRGRTSGNHSNEHEMKEYSSYVSINQVKPTVIRIVHHGLRKSALATKLLIHSTDQYEHFSLQMLLTDFLNKTKMAVFLNKNFF
jgi:hypothetical protein